MDNKNKKKVKKYQWLIVLIITTVIAMYLYGMTRVYFPDPIPIGFDQYLDVGVGIVIFCLVISGFIVAAIFGKDKKKKR